MSFGPEAELRDQMATLAFKTAQEKKALKEENERLKERLKQCEADLLAPFDWRQRIPLAIEEWESMKKELEEARKNLNEVLRIRKESQLEAAEVENHGQWETGVPDLFFRCTHGVFPVGRGSLCYVTSEVRAEYIVKELKAAHSLRTLLTKCSEEFTLLVGYLIARSDFQAAEKIENRVLKDLRKELEKNS